MHDPSLYKHCITVLEKEKSDVQPLPLSKLMWNWESEEAGQGDANNSPHKAAASSLRKGKENNKRDGREKKEMRKNGPVSEQVEKVKDEVMVAAWKQQQRRVQKDESQNKRKRKKSQDEEKTKTEDEKKEEEETKEPQKQARLKGENKRAKHESEGMNLFLVQSIVAIDE